MVIVVIAPLASPGASKGLTFPECDKGLVDVADEDTPVDPDVEINGVIRLSVVGDDKSYRVAVRLKDVEAGVDAFGVDEQSRLTASRDLFQPGCLSGA